MKDFVCQTGRKLGMYTRGTQTKLTAVDKCTQFESPQSCDKGVTCALVDPNHDQSSDESEESDQDVNELHDPDWNLSEAMADDEDLDDKIDINSEEM